MFFSLLLAYKMVTRLTDTPTIMLPTLSPLSVCLFGQLIPKLAPGEIVQLTFVLLASPLRLQLFFNFITVAACVYFCVPYCVSCLPLSLSLACKFGPHISFRIEN